MVICQHRLHSLKFPCYNQPEAIATKIEHDAEHYQYAFICVYVKRS